MRSGHRCGTASECIESSRIFCSLLGAATYATNNHKVEVRDSSGQMVSTTIRDSSPGNSSHKNSCASQPQDLDDKVIATHKTVSAQPPAVSRRIQRMKGSASVASAQSELLFQTWWRQSRDTRTFSAPPAGDAARRLDALRARLKARL